MKKIVLTLVSAALLLMGTNVFAQGKYGADSAECIKYLSYYKEYFKQKNYDESLPNWRKAYKLCPPTASQNLLIDGTTLLRREIQKQARNVEYRNALVDSLLALHDIRAEYYPNYAITARNNKGVDMSNFIKDDNKRLYEGYSEIIKVNGEQTKPSIFLFQLNAALEEFRAGNLTAEDIINTYQNAIEVLGNATADTDAEAEQLASIKTDVESLFISSKVASCENLISLFTPRYEANPNDLELVSNIVKMMSTADDCTSNELFLKAATSMYALDPSYNSAYFLYRLNSAKGNVNDALKYMEEAIAYPESDDATDGNYYYELATFCFKNGMNSRAYEAAGKAITLAPELAGKAYFLMGSIWGATRCSGNEIETRAPYWVAVDYLNRAKSADDSLTEEANRLIGQYSVYFPETAEAFMYDLTNGESYTVSCGGMRATTTVRTRR